MAWWDRQSRPQALGTCDHEREVPLAAMQPVARELGLLVRSLKALHQDVLATSGVRVELPAAAALGMLAERGRMRPSALAEALMLDLSSVSRQVAALEREGWVSRERDPADSRAALLDLTDAGAQVLARVREARAALLEQLLPDWDDDELAVFAAQLRRFRTDMERSRLPEPAVPPADDPVGVKGRARA